MDWPRRRASHVTLAIHYRFDKDAGLTLARTVAAYAIAHDVSSRQPYAFK